MTDEALDFRLTATDLASAKFAGLNKQLGATQGAAVKASGGLMGFASSAMAGAKQSILMGIGLGAGITAFNLMGRAVSAAVGFLENSVRAAAGEETSIASLTAALKANVAGYNGNSDAIEKVINSRLRLGYTDIEQRQQLGALVAMVQDTSAALKIEGIAMDAAAVTGKDFSAVNIALGKAFTGNTAALKRLGIVVDKGVTGYDLLNAVQARFAGGAEAFSKTTAGAAKALAAEWEKLQEDIGTQLLPVLVDLAHFAMNDLIPALRQVAQGVHNIGAVASYVGQTWATVGMDFGSMGDKIHMLADRAGVDFDTVKDRIAADMHATGDSFATASDKVGAEMGLITDSVATGFRASAKESRTMMSDIHAAMADGHLPQVAKELITDPVWQAAYDARQQAQQEAAKIPRAMGDAMLQKEKDLTDSIATLLTFTADALTPGEAKAQAIAFLTSAAYADALASGKPAAIAKAQELANAANIVLWGEAANALAAGTGVGKAWVAGLNAALAAGYTTLTYTWMYKYTKLLSFAGSPDFTHALKAGLGVGKAWVKGVGQGLGGDKVKMPLLPGMSSGGLALAAAAPAGFGGSSTIVNFNSTWPPTPEQAREVAEIVDRQLYYKQSGSSRFPRG